MKIRVLLSIFFIAFSMHAQETLSLEAIRPVRPPIIQKNRITYTLEFAFKKCPQEYWVFYDKTSKKMVIDFYGFRIAAPQLAIKGTSFARDPEIKNIETSLSLTGNRAQILFSLEEGWHHESSVVSGKILQLHLWRNLKPAEIVNKRKYNPVVPIVITALCAGLATFTIIVLANLNSSEK